MSLPKGDDVAVLLLDSLAMPERGLAQVHFGRSDAELHNCGRKLQKGFERKSNKRNFHCVFDFCVLA